MSRAIIWCGCWDRSAIPGRIWRPRIRRSPRCLQAAGDVQLQADLSWVEVTSTEIDAPTGTSRTVRRAYKGQGDDFIRVPLRPLDVIRLRPVFSDRDEGRVVVAGQVRYPGIVRHHAGRASVVACSNAPAGSPTKPIPTAPSSRAFPRPSREKEGNERAANELQSAGRRARHVATGEAAAAGAQLLRRSAISRR